MRIADLVLPDELPRVAPEIARLSTGETIATEWRVRRKDGTLYVAEVTAKQVSDGRIQSFARDITCRKAAEAALWEGEERLRRAVRAGRVGLWEWDLRTHKNYYSEEWKRQIGYEDDEVSDTLDEWQRRVHPEDLPVVLERLQSFVSGDEPEYEAVFRLRHKDGSYRHILSQGSRVLGDDGVPVRVLGSHVDITERTELHAQFLQAQKMESVGRLAGGLAHDFNNLLTVINTTADLAIMNLSEGDALRADLEQIRLAGDRAAGLTRQLLAMSRQQILKAEVLDLNAVIGDMQAVLRRLVGDDVELVFQPSARPGRVKADPGQIEQVILNLAVNARDAMPQGGTLTIETRDVEFDARDAADHPSTRPGPYVMLAVSDTGTGMEHATRKRIFEPFFTTKERGKGTGLGLSTVYGIVKQSGGSIWVESHPGAGTTFRIYLPPVDQAPRQAPPAQASTPPPVQGTETILLVEDESALRHLAQRILQSAGYTVLEATGGEEALQVLESHAGALHLLLTDVVMPGMNGRELAARVLEVRPDIRVLYTSGYTDDAVLRLGVMDDDSRFMGKPYTAAEVRRRVRETLDS